VGDRAGRAGLEALAERFGLTAGGVTRGPASAPLLWGEVPDGDTSRFQAEALSAARFRDRESSAPLGEGATRPETDPTREGAGLVEVAGSTGGTTWKRRLAPRHRRVVRDFFPPASSTEAAGEGPKGTKENETR
jgi:hypothetical protein